MKESQSDPPPRAPASVVLGFGTSMFIVGAYFLALSPLLSDITSDLHAGPETWGYPGGAYSLALGLAALLLSPLQDRFPRPTMIAAGVVGHLFGISVVATLGATLIIRFRVAGPSAGARQVSPAT